MQLSDVVQHAFSGRGVRWDADTRTLTFAVYVATVREDQPMRREGLFTFTKFKEWNVYPEPLYDIYTATVKPDGDVEIKRVMQDQRLADSGLHSISVLPVLQFQQAQIDALRENQRERK